MSKFRDLSDTNYIDVRNTLRWLIKKLLGEESYGVRQSKSFRRKPNNLADLEGLRLIIVRSFSHLRLEPTQFCCEK